MHEDQTGTREGEPIFDSLIWQPHLALLSAQITWDRMKPATGCCFPCELNLVAMIIFTDKGLRFPVGSITQRLNIFLAAREWSDCQANELVLSRTFGFDIALQKSL